VPVRLRIPKLGVDAPVEAVGLTASGEMRAPNDRFHVGWYKSGYVPGALGNAVLAGHSMHTKGRGVLYQLDHLAVSDPVYIRTATHELSFTVARMVTYPAEGGPLDEVFGAANKAQLNLITCVGTWDAVTHQYASRLVVFTEFVGEQALPQ
jgi:sortase (surface protein transpeptidase)